MKFNVELTFYKKDQNSSEYDIGEQINFSNIPEPIQKKIIEVIKNSIKFKNYLEKNISNMGFDGAFRDRKFQRHVAIRIAETH